MFASRHSASILLFAVIVFFRLTLLLLGLVSFRNSLLLLLFLLLLLSFLVRNILPWFLTDLDDLNIVIIAHLITDDHLLADV